MSHGNHLKHMLYGGVAVFAVLAVSGIPLGTALTYGALLACPLMMIGMMLTMGGHDSAHGTGRSDASSDAAAHGDRRHESDPAQFERR